MTGGGGGVGGAPKVRHRYIEGGRTSEVHFYSDIINERPLRKKPNINIPSPPPKRGFHTPTPPLKIFKQTHLHPIYVFQLPPPYATYRLHYNPPPLFPPFPRRIFCPTKKVNFWILDTLKIHVQCGTYLYMGVRCLSSAELVSKWVLSALKLSSMLNSLQYVC